MADKTYRVIQWATGTVGSAALRYFIENPVIELAGVYVTNPEKVGKDAGDLVGLPRTGITATDDIEAIVALEADCVLFAPVNLAATTLDNICRLLASGKPRCGQVRDSQRDWLFGTGTVEVGSVALVPLGPGGNVGLLACGSGDANRFNPSMSTDFLIRIAELIAAAVA